VGQDQTIRFWDKTAAHRVRSSVLGQWDVRWPRSKAGSALRYLDKSPPVDSISASVGIPVPPLPYYLLYRPAQNRSLADYRHKAGFVASPACEVCGAAVESRAHYLLECPAWEPHRQPLHAASRSGGRLGRKNSRIRDGKLQGWMDLESPLRDASRAGRASQGDTRPGADLARRVQGPTRP
jgi:hypothetical protein